MAAVNVTSELDRPLEERWDPCTAGAEPRARAGDDAQALVEELKEEITSALDPAGPKEAAIKRAFDPESTKLALALAIVEDARRMSSASRTKMAERLDELEDLLDGLFVAIEELRSASGGAVRG
jgi:hypothetical protein